MAQHNGRSRKRPAGIDRAVESAGSQAELARRLTDAGHRVTQQAVSLWVARGIVPTLAAAAAVERVTGVSIAELAPSMVRQQQREEATA